MVGKGISAIFESSETGEVMPTKIFESSNISETGKRSCPPKLVCMYVTLTITYLHEFFEPIH